MSDQNARTVSVCWSGGMNALGDALLHRREDNKSCGNQPNTHLGTDLETAAVEDGNELCPACEWPDGCEAVLEGEYVHESEDRYRCGNCGETRWAGSVSWWTSCHECGASDWEKVATGGGVDRDGEVLYRTPERGEDHPDRNLPLGWIADRVTVPDEWEEEFTERGACLRFRRRVDRDTFGLRGPGWPGVGITSGSDYWAIIGDTDRAIRDVWHDPDDDPDAVVASVEEAITAVEADLERTRLSALLNDRVPTTVVENLVDRFDTADGVLAIEDDTPTLESVEGVGPRRREIIQQELGRYKMQQSDAKPVVETHPGGDADV